VEERARALVAGSSFAPYGDGFSLFRGLEGSYARLRVGAPSLDRPDRGID